MARTISGPAIRICGAREHNLKNIDVDLRRDPEVRLAPLLLIAWILFILVVNGPIASPKYRLPLEPAFAVFVALAFDDLRRRLTRVRAASPQE